MNNIKLKVWGRYNMNHNDTEQFDISPFLDKIKEHDVDISLVELDCTQYHYDCFLDLYDDIENFRLINSIVLQPAQFYLGYKMWIVRGYKDGL